MKTKPVSRGSWKVILRKDIPFFYSDYIKSILNLTPVEGGGGGYIEIYIKERST